MLKPRITRARYGWFCNGRHGVTPARAYQRWLALGDFR